MEKYKKKKLNILHVTFCFMILLCTFINKCFAISTINTDSATPSTNTNELKEEFFSSVAGLGALLETEQILLKELKIYVNYIKQHAQILEE